MARNVGARRSRVNPGWPLTTAVNEKRAERAPPVQINVNARRRSIAFHRIEERGIGLGLAHRSEAHTSELESIMRISYAVYCSHTNKFQTATFSDSTPVQAKVSDAL